MISSYRETTKCLFSAVECAKSSEENSEKLYILSVHYLSRLLLRLYANSRFIHRFPWLTGHNVQANIAHWVLTTSTTLLLGVNNTSLMLITPRLANS